MQPSQTIASLFSNKPGLGWAGLGWAGLGWPGLGWPGKIFIFLSKSSCKKGTLRTAILAVKNEILHGKT